jgi:hypothetical protein
MEVTKSSLTSTASENEYENAVMKTQNQKLTYEVDKLSAELSNLKRKQLRAELEAKTCRCAVITKMVESLQGTTETSNSNGVS